MEADDIDRRILTGLLANGRASTSELAAVADVNDTTADWHKDVLEAAEVISGYEPQLDYGLLGYDLTAVIRLDAVASARDRLTAMLGDEPHLHTVYEVTGGHDIFAVGKFTDRDALERFRDELRADDGVTAIGIDVATPVIEFEWFSPD
jgi:DNA-binding Lrp family transcriptional regulator